MRGSPSCVPPLQGIAVLLPPYVLLPTLIAACASAGAPGAPVSTSQGTFNPVHELLKEVSAVAPAALTSAAEVSTWGFPSAAPSYISPVPVPLPLAPPLSGLSDLEQSFSAEQRAAARGWTGEHRAALFRGLLAGFAQALAGSPWLTADFDPRFGTYNAGTQLQVTPVALPASMRTELLQRLDANPCLQGGEPLYRHKLADDVMWALDKVWERCTPAIILVGTPGGSVPLPTDTFPVKVV